MWVWVLSGAAYLAQEVGRQVLVDGEVPFLLGQAGESDGWGRLRGGISSAYVSQGARFQSLRRLWTRGDKRRRRLTFGAAKAEATARLRASLNMLAAGVCVRVFTEWLPMEQGRGGKARQG